MNNKILKSLIKKEFLQIIRDKSNLLIAFLFPTILMILFAFAINFDNDNLRVGLLIEGYKDNVRTLESSFKGTKFLKVIDYNSRQEMEKDIIAGKIKAMVIIPNDFAKNLYNENTTSCIQLLIDGSDPNISTFVEGYVSGVVANWQKMMGLEEGIETKSLLDIQSYVWFNPTLETRNVILPSSIANIITVVGMVLTALVIAREWERGTMESLLTTRVNKMELLISKYIAYYFLTLLSVIYCSFVCIVIFKIPFHGSYLVYFITSSLFILTSISQGFLISTIAKNQFLASISAGVFGMMPATMLSGMVFEISSMPFIIQLITYIVPARYFSACIRNLYNAGNMWGVLFQQSLFMIVFTAIFFVLIYRKTQTRLEA